ncbi:dihydroorotase [Clostridia bacterium]|nr:dihydroorotase [Clostridia bacterium]
MRTIIAGGMVYRDGRLCRENLLIEDDKIAAFGGLERFDGDSTDSILDFDNCIISPGFVDVHVHLRQPGFSYKETVATGTSAAARGGYTCVAAMPNLNPVPDSHENLQQSLALYDRDAVVRVRAVGAITRGEAGLALSDMDALAPQVAGFSDDGKGVQSESIMREAMRRARTLDRPIMAHCEDEALRDGKRVTAACEWRQVERDLRLVKETGCRYHVQHVSCLESVELIRKAKAEGLPITCETAPHYLLLNDETITDDGRFAMNPPIRSKADQVALIDALRDGTIDCIATDHAPHTAGEKSGGLHGSVNGIVGLETAFPALYTKLVLSNQIPIERLLNALTAAPRALLNEPPGMRIGSPADITVLDISTPYAIDSTTFASMGRSTPFDGWSVRGRSVLTMVGARIVWDGRS